MPYFPAVASASFAPDWPNPPVSTRRATRAMPRRCMSWNTRSTAMRSEVGILNTHFRTGSTMTTAPASDRSGTCARSTSGTMAMVEPVLVGPMMRSTRSDSIRRLAKVLALAASLPSS